MAETNAASSFPNAALLSFGSVACREGVLATLSAGVLDAAAFGMRSHCVCRYALVHAVCVGVWQCLFPMPAKHTKGEDAGHGTSDRAGLLQSLPCVCTSRPPSLEAVQPAS